MSTSLPNEEQFYSRIEQGLAGYPRLRSILPPEYPRAGRSRIDRECALRFEEMRTGRFAHNVNLPLVLYLVGYEEARSGARSFARQMLQDLETFAATFGSTPRVQQVLEPLWTAPWDRGDPKIWSVVAHARTSLQLQHTGASILAFEAPTGAGNATADIQFRKEDQEYLLDLEMWHAATGATAEEIRETGVRRAEAKAAQKFARLPPGKIGIVQEICFAVGESFERILNDQHILSGFPLRETERCVGILGMICGRSDESGQLQSYYLATSETARLPLRSRAAR